jgi:hypothetical protein
MKHKELWQAKLKAAYAERRIVIRQHNASERSIFRLNKLINELEQKIDGNMAKS